MLEEDDTLATEATGEEDKDGTGLETRAWLCRVNGFAGLRHKASVNRMAQPAILDIARRMRKALMPTLVRKPAEDGDMNYLLP